jgi:4-amino-4-deoxychorismate lyase
MSPARVSPACACISLASTARLGASAFRSQPVSKTGCAPPLQRRPGRLTFDANGRMDITTASFVSLAPDAVWTVRIAKTRLDSADKLLRVKTTRRAVYEAARAEFPSSEADEVIMLNERNEVCEGTITSVFLDHGSGVLRTPPISSGLLAGVLRTELICQRRARVGRITCADLDTGTIYVGNSLRGLIRAELIRN